MVANSQPTDDAPLTPAEQDALAQLEQEVLAGLDTFITVGNALAEIKSSKLYRQTHTSFEQYLDDRFHRRLSRRRAYQLIDYAEVCTAVHSLDAPVPTSEGEARELSGLSAEEAAAVMVAVTESGEPVTSNSIKSTRANLTKPDVTIDKVAAARRLVDAIQAQKEAVVAEIQEALDEGVPAIVLLSALRCATEKAPADPLVTPQMMAPIFASTMEMLEGFVVRAALEVYEDALADESPAQDRSD